jgi:YbbR domain-containing protein
MTFLGQNLGIKLLSLICSISLFLYVHKQQASERTVYVPLTVLRDPTTRVVEESTVRRSVRVTLTGPADRLKTVAEQVRAVADLTGQRSGTYPAKVDVKIPTEAQDEVTFNYQPQVVPIQLEGRTSRRLPVNVTVTVQPPAGLSFSNQQVTPKIATVYGWERTVRRVRHLQAVVNSLGSGAGTGIEQEVPVRAVDSQGADVGEEIQVQPPTIKVMVQLIRSVWSKPVYVSPTLGQMPRTVRIQRISVTPTRLTLRGPEAAVGPVQYLETEPIPMPETAEVVDREVRVLLPPGVRTEETPRVRVVITLQGAPS